MKSLMQVINSGIQFGCRVLHFDYDEFVYTVYQKKNETKTTKTVIR